MSRSRKIIKERCIGIERQKLFANIREISQVFYCEIKRKCGKNEYSDIDASKERCGIGRLKAGTWKLRRIRRGFEKRCHLCLGEEKGVKHTLLDCIETKTWKKK
jgi:hypothetical protein